jgi:hypothetical protein
MALTNYKTIENRKGYLVKEDDRKVFESGTQKTNFGLGVDDHIEFILYDSNDNQLPQGDSQSLVRYISVNDESSRKYFLTSDNKETRKGDAQEFIVDIERLIKEAGYSNGVFKTSTTIVNRRIGKDNSSQNQLWIQEISPSRTEIRVLPLNPSGNINKDLEKRYSVFTRDGQFRDDAIYFVDQFIEKVKVENVLRNFISSKGKVTSGQNYINLLKREFGINDFQDFVRRIEEDWKKSLKNYFYNEPQDVELSSSILKEVSRTKLIEVINKYLPKRDINERSILTKDEIETFDRVQTLLKTLQDKNKEFVSAELKYKAGEISGCTDPNSLNYNPDATIDDGSCKYKEDETTDDTDKKNTNEDTTTEETSKTISVKLKNNLEVAGLLNYQIPGKAALLEDGTQSFTVELNEGETKKLRVYSPGGLPLIYESNSIIKNKNEEVIGTFIYPGWEITLTEDIVIENILKTKDNNEETENTNTEQGTSGSPTNPAGNTGGVD